MTNTLNAIEKLGETIKVWKSEARRLKNELIKTKKILTKFRAAAKSMAVVIGQTKGVQGWNLDGTLAPWAEFDFVNAFENAMKMRRRRRKNKEINRGEKA